MRSSINLESDRDDELGVGREGHEEGPDLVALEEDGQRQRYGSKADLAFIQSGNDRVRIQLISASTMYMIYLKDGYQNCLKNLPTNIKCYELKCYAVKLKKKTSSTSSFQPVRFSCCVKCIVRLSKQKINDVSNRNNRNTT